MRSGTQSSAATQAGVHRLIVALYALLTLAALGRSSFQLLTKFDEAPVAYSLSGLAAVVYVVATVSLALGFRPRFARLALLSLSFELTGVVVVGLVSVLVPSLFPDATVWSQFGLGYLLIPLFLPIVGLWWLGKKRVSP